MRVCIRVHICFIVFIQWMVDIFTSSTYGVNKRLRSFVRFNNSKKHSHYTDAVILGYDFVMPCLTVRSPRRNVSVSNAASLVKFQG